MPGLPFGRWLFRAALRVVPPRWRSEVRRDLIDESNAEDRHGAAWIAWQAVRIGLRLRTSPSTIVAAPGWRSLLESLRFELGAAARSLRLHRTWTATAVMTLALGLGANTAVFSVVKATLLDPLPYRDADRLVLPSMTDTGHTISMTPDSALARGWRQNARTLESLEGYAFQTVTMTGAGDPVTLHAAAISDTLPAFTGIPMLRGRGFSAEETLQGARPVAILAERIWRARFGADPDLIGREIVVDGRAHTIIGVMPDRMRLGGELQSANRREIYLPFAAGRVQGMQIMARLNPGVSDAQVLADLDGIASAMGLNRAGPFELQTSLLRPDELTDLRDSLRMLTWAVVAVLLIACVNVAHLLIAQGLSRERELAIRTTLGARPAHVARQLVFECLLLAAAGGLAGFGLGAALIRMLVANRPPALETLGLVSIDWTTAGATAAATVVTGLCFGFMAVWRAFRLDAVSTLRATGAGPSSGWFRGHGPSVLIVAEVGGAAMLLVGALLLVRSVANLQGLSLGFDPTPVYTMRVPVAPGSCTPRPQAPVPESCRAVLQQWLDRVSEVPGVELATLASDAPPQRSGYSFAPWETHAGVVTAGERAITALNQVRPEYFSVLGLPLIEGRGFDAGSAGRHEVIVNRALATRLWPNDSALGQQVRAAPVPRPGSPPVPTPPWSTVVGVVGDSVVRNVRRATGEWAFYSASDYGGQTLVIRAAPGANLAAAVRAIALEINPQLALPAVINVAAALDEDSISASRFNMQLLTALALVASLLAAVGLNGVLSQALARRTREFGIRLSLGGTPGHVARLVFRRVLVLTAAGLALGFAGARWSASMLMASLFGVNESDPVAFAATGMLIGLVTLLACAVPLLRAMRVSPLTATRAD